MFTISSGWSPGNECLGLRKMQGGFRKATICGTGYEEGMNCNGKSGWKMSCKEGMMSMIIWAGSPQQFMTSSTSRRETAARVFSFHSGIIADGIIRGTESWSQDDW